LYGDDGREEEADRIASRLAEMQTLHYLERPHHSRGVKLG